MSKLRNRRKPSRNLVHTTQPRVEWKVKFYNLMRWRKKSRKIYKRDNYQCQACLHGYVDQYGKQIIKPEYRYTPVEHGKRQGVVHHIIELTYPPETPSNWDDDNLLLVCHYCHNVIHDKVDDLHRNNETYQKNKRFKDTLNVTDVANF